MPVDNPVALIENWIYRYDSLRKPQTPAAPDVSSERRGLWWNHSVAGQPVIFSFGLGTIPIHF